MKVELVGGPLDGRQKSSTAPPAYLWIDADLRFYKADGRGRALYRYLGKGKQRGMHAYLYAGHTHRRCANCGVYIERRAGSNCALCGEAVAA